MRSLNLFNRHDVIKYNDYHEYPFKGITERILKENIFDSDILYWEPLEPLDAPFSYNPISKGISEFSDLLKSRNIKIYAVYSDYHLSDFGIENVEVIRWKTSLLHYCKSSAEFSYKDSIYNIRIKDDNFKKLFSSLNLGVRPARVTLLDNLYKNNLFGYGDISWNHLTTEDRFKSLNLSFKYWKETQLKIDFDEMDCGNKNEIHDNHLWTDYYLKSNCLMMVQCESIVFDGGYDTVQFLSEKTWKPLLLGQPFLNVGSCGYYNYIEKLGFKLYDEIIDYSFDKIDNTEQRILGIIDELNKLKDQDYNILYNKIKSKIDYNRELCLSLLKNDTFIPNEFKNLYSLHKSSIDNLSEIEMNMNLKEIFEYLK
jgi:hypothetical protein